MVMHGQVHTGQLPVSKDLPCWSHSVDLGCLIKACPPENPQPFRTTACWLCLPALSDPWYLGVYMGCRRCLRECVHVCGCIHLNKKNFFFNGHIGSLLFESDSLLSASNCPEQKTCWRWVFTVLLQHKHQNFGRVHYLLTGWLWCGACSTPQ